MELPLREIQFDIGENGAGVFAVSAVSDPAIKKTYTFFNEQKPIRFSVQNEEERIAFAPVLIPDQKIYRNIDGYEFNLVVRKDTIKKIAIDFYKNNRANLVNLEHKEKAEGVPAVIDGVTMFQSLITDERTVASVKGYENLPIGTWFIGAYFSNDQVWQGIKDGTFTGWSIHAGFESKLVKMSSMTDEELKPLLQKFFKQLF